MTDKQTEYCYSWNGEDFSRGVFDSIPAALADAAGDNDEGLGTVHVGEVSRPCNSLFYPDADDVIDHMITQADDYAGEYASDYPDVSAEEKADLSKQLEALLDAWCQKCGISPTFYQVRNVKEYPLPVSGE